MFKIAVVAAVMVGDVYIWEIRIHTRTSGDYASKTVCRSESLMGPLKIPALEHIVRI